MDMEMKGNKLKKYVHCNTTTRDPIVTIFVKIHYILCRSYLEHNFNLVGFWGHIFTV